MNLSTEHIIKTKQYKENIGRKVISEKTPCKEHNIVGVVPLNDMDEEDFMESLYGIDKGYIQDSDIEGCYQGYQDYNELDSMCYG